MLGSCIRVASPKIGWWESSSIIFSALRIDPVNSSETWLAPELISAERMIDERVARAVPESLELVEDDHEVLRQRAQRGQLGVQRLGVLFGLDARAPHGALDHLDVEADLLLQETDLTLSGAPQLLDRVAHHRVVDAADEPRDADDALEVDLDDVERRRVLAVRLGQLQRELVHERRLARVAGPEQRDVGLRLQRQRDLVGERLHPDDLRRVVERPVPDERVERHRTHCTAQGVQICTGHAVQA